LQTALIAKLLFRLILAAASRAEHKYASVRLTILRGAIRT
jgi:hypothetical protein